MDISPVKILVVLVVALIVLGPQRLPEIAKRAGQTWRDMQRFRQQLRSEVDGLVDTVTAPSASAAPSTSATAGPPPVDPLPVEDANVGLGELSEQFN